MRQRACVLFAVLLYCYSVSLCQADSVVPTEGSQQTLSGSKESDDDNFLELEDEPEIVMLSGQPISFSDDDDESFSPVMLPSSYMPAEFMNQAFRISPNWERDPEEVVDENPVDTNGPLDIEDFLNLFLPFDSLLQEDSIPYVDADDKLENVTHIVTGHVAGNIMESLASRKGGASQARAPLKAVTDAVTVPGASNLLGNLVAGTLGQIISALVGAANDSVSPKDGLNKVAADVVKDKDAGNASLSGGQSGGTGGNVTNPTDQPANNASGLGGLTSTLTSKYENASSPAVPTESPVGELPGATKGVTGQQADTAQDAALGGTAEVVTKPAPKGLGGNTDPVTTPANAPSDYKGQQPVPGADGQEATRAPDAEAAREATTSVSVSGRGGEKEQTEVATEVGHEKMTEAPWNSTAKY